MVDFWESLGLIFPWDGDPFNLEFLLSFMSNALSEKENIFLLQVRVPFSSAQEILGSGSRGRQSCVALTKCSLGCVGAGVWMCVCVEGHVCV